MDIWKINFSPEGGETLRKLLRELSRSQGCWSSRRIWTTFPGTSWDFWGICGSFSTLAIPRFYFWQVTKEALAGEEQSCQSFPMPELCLKIKNPLPRPRVPHPGALWGGDNSSGHQARGGFGATKPFLPGHPPRLGREILKNRTVKKKHGAGSLGNSHVGDWP